MTSQISTPPLDEPLRLVRFEEPQIEFGHGQSTADPRDGLTLFGPLKTKRREVRVGVIGRAEGVARYHAWAETIRHPIVPSPEVQDVRRVMYPGFEAVFGAVWDPSPTVEIVIPDDDLMVIYLDDRQQRVYKAVNAYADRIIRSIREDDGGDVDVWYVVVPEDLHKNCRPQSMVGGAQKIKAAVRIPRNAVVSTLTQEDLFSDRAEERDAAKAELHDPDFRRQLKARLLTHRAVTQLVREDTLAPRKAPRADRKSDEEHTLFEANAAWRLTTAAFYKAGGVPWKAADIRPGVCYVGLTYKRLDDLRYRDDRTACCAAQMFLDSGDGVVFKGAVGPWYGKKAGDYHLTREAAANVMHMATEAYREIRGEYPRELFIHGRTQLWREEWEGFSEGAPDETTVVGVRIRDEPHFRIYRDDPFPVMRGLAYLVDESTAYVWTKGYVPRLQTYPGLEVPKPLMVQIVRGKAEIETVVADVLMLTKLNYNTTDFADGDPVTLKFADRVGAILTAGPPGDNPPLLHFRHYI